jgi:hypothetical protein
MSKDGPPSSGGYRYGSRNALRANIPAKALNPRGIVTQADSQARQNLFDFAAYPARTKSIGKPIPATRGISTRRAAALQKIQELEKQLPAQRYFSVIDRKFKKLKLFYNDTRDRFWFVEENLLGRFLLLSLSYENKNRAMRDFTLGRITWIERRAIPTPTDGKV